MSFPPFFGSTVWLLISVASLLEVGAQPPISPPLSIQVLDKQFIRLSWPMSASNVVLQETSALLDRSIWKPSLQTPVFQNGNYQVTVRTDGGGKFFRLRTPDLLTVRETSPRDGERAVSLNRETVFNLSYPLSTATVISNTQLYAEAAGRRVLTRVEIASDRRKATLFYLENIPGNARVRVTFKGEGVRDELNRPVDLDGDGTPGGNATLFFDTLSVTPVAQSAVSGRVFASEPASGAGTNSINKPLAGVTITVDGMEETLRTTTDSQGNFRLDPVPTGRFFVTIDGRPATNGLPPGAYYPYVGKAWEGVAGHTVPAGGTGEIYLPLIQAGTLQPVSLTEATMVTFPPEVLQKNPELTGVTLQVPANSLFSDNGIRGGRVGIAPVSPDRLPERLPPGLEFPMVITVQTDGPSNFDRPVPVCFPNLPDPNTKQPLPPGTQNYLYSFDHDIGRFVPIGSMTVSADGRMICTDPGVGIVEPGWHGSGPPPVEPPPPATPPCDPSVGPEACRELCAGRAKTCYYIARQWSYGRAAACARRFPAGTDEFWNCQDEWWPGWEEKQDACFREEKACVDRCFECEEGSPTRQSAGSTKPRLTAAQPPASFDRIDTILGEMFALISPYAAARQTPPANVLNQIRSFLDEIGRLTGGNPEQVLSDAVIASEEEFARVHNGLFYTPGNAPSYPVFYVATIERPAGLFYLRGETGPEGQYSLFVPRDGKLLDVAFYDPRTKRYGAVYPILSRNSRYRLPPFYLAPLNPSLHDFDRDNLPDVVELVFGTDAANADTDNDGVADGTEVDQGTNPVDGFAVRTGVVASIDTPGTAVDVCALNDLAVVADSDRGVALVNLQDLLNPVLVAQIDTPGNAQAVASAPNFAVVADGPAGLAIIDLTNPSNARILHQIAFSNTTVQAVEAAGDVAFAGLASGELVAIDPASGAIIKRVDASGPVHDLALNGDELYVLTDSSLLIYRIREGLLRLSSLQIKGQPAPLESRRKLFVGGGFAYVGYATGFSSIAVTNRFAPRLLGSPGAVQLAINDLDANGAGWLVAVTSFAGEGTLAVSLYDVSQPTNVTQFLTSFETPGNPRAAAIYNGLAYVADGSAGLQVINYREYDRAGKAPAIARLTTNFAEGRAEEGKPMRVTADAVDDVQVRNVELYLNGERVGTDGNFPFEFRFTSPFKSAGPSFTLRARAVDTGGNEVWSPEMNVVLVSDASPPQVVRTSPPSGAIATVDAALLAEWNEPLDPATVSAESFKLFAAGPDDTLGTPDDVPVVGGTVLYRGAPPSTALSFPTLLLPGSYRAVVRPPIADLAGNRLGGEFWWTFTIARPLQFGDTVAGELRRPGERHAFSFSGQRGERVRLRATDPNGNFGIAPMVDLEDANGSPLGSVSSPTEAALEIVLETSGTFFAFVSDQGEDQQGAYDFSIQRLNVPPGAVAVQSGQTVGGSLTNGAEMNAFSFNAAAGEHVRIRMSDPNGNFGIDPRIELFDAQGNRMAVTESPTDAVLEVTMNSSGTFYLLLSDSGGDDQGEYGLAIARLNVPVGAVPLQSGQVLAGNLGSGAEMDAFSFQAAAGERIRIRMSDPNGNFGIDPQIELFDAQGNRMAVTESPTDAVLEVTLNSSGTFYALLSDLGGDDQGEYALAMVRLNVPVGAVALEYGQVLPGNLASGAEMDAFSFQAAAGERVRIRMSDPNGNFGIDPQIELFDAQGNRMEVTESPTDAVLEVTLNNSGTFYILLSDSGGDDQGEYDLAIARLNVPVGAVALQSGQVLAGHLANGAEMDAFSFNAAAGERVRIRMSDPDGNFGIDPQIELFDAQGNRMEVTESPTDAVLEVAVNNSGTFYILLSDSGGDDQGDYGVTLLRLNDPPGARSLALGQPVTGTLASAAEVHVYAFAVVAGEKVRVRLEDPAGVFGIEPAIEVLDLAGERVASANDLVIASVDVQLSASGKLTVLVSDFEGDDTGSYTLTLERIE